MIDARKALGAAIAHRTNDEEQDKAAVAHFNAQADLFTQCPGCKAHLTGTLEQIRSHRCDISDLIGV